MQFRREFMTLSPTNAETQTTKLVSALMLIGILSKLMGFLREVVLANCYGATAHMDAFNIANNIPVILLAGLAAAITNTFIPTFINKKENNGLDEALGLSQRLFTVTGFTGVLLSLLGIILAPQIAIILAPKFSPEKLAITANLSRILLIGGAVAMSNGFLTGFLQANRSLIIPALVGFPSNLMIIVVVLLFSEQHGIYALAFGSVASFVAQFLFQLPFCLKKKLVVAPKLEFPDPDVRRVVRLVLPVFAGSLVLQINTIFDRIFASGLPDGSIAALGYANRLTGLVFSIVTTAVVTVSLPIMAQAAAVKQMSALKDAMLTAIRGSNCLIMPMSVGMIVLRCPIVKLVFERGAFDSAATELTATALLYLSLGLVAYSIREIVSRVFYAIEDTKTPMINSIFSVSINIMIMILSVPRLGLVGVTLSTSLSGMVSAAMLLFRLRRKIGSVHGKSIIKSLKITIIAALLMAAAVHFSYIGLEHLVQGTSFLMQTVRMAVTVAVGVLVYVLVLYIFKAEELQFVKNLIRRKG
jgi:putative peptidoglycan lipid II flippase